MKLFIDTHSSKITIALIVKSNIIIKEKITSHDHSSHVVNMITGILKENGYTKKDIEEIIVVNGPGSFTGVRIGVVIAKTLAFTLNIPIKTISSIEALAVSDKGNFDVITVEDPKGFYYALKNDLDNINYLKKEPFEDFIKSNKFEPSYNKKLGIKNINDYLSKRKHLNPIHVNPIYIKKLNI